ncbi:MAG: DNA mismatch repair protein MutS [Herbinix sp.]|nr:DNA mismatch repair protein MutS [Herbinix sp.]
MLSFLKSNRSILNRIYTNLGFLDSMIAAASFRVMLPLYCKPELVKSSRPHIGVTDLYHPLIEEPVLNSITENRSVLLTGSNASGKSTFIKTLAINAILSQSIYTSISKSYRGSFFMTYSSMALRDNIFSKESYYIVEIKSLKRILDRVNNEIPTLCFIDEVLRGTNTLERIAASSRILSSLARKNTLVFAATHDIELTHILENDYSNYHFQEKIEENKIIFDYKLYKGKAISKNAIKLLNMMGYPKEIIASAEGAAEEFLKTGEWSNIK